MPRYDFKQPMRRINVILPEKLVRRLENTVAQEERNVLIAEAIEDYLDYLENETEREERREKRRETVGRWWDRVRTGSRRAAESLLPE